MSGKKLRHQLEKKLDVDLADQKKVIDELAMEILKEKKTAKKKKNDSEDEDDNDVMPYLSSWIYYDSCV